ncbi:hypothetical protein sos41_12080 [Alphaproteobacteria bacterium SO-S41]|nr:hypothetical protein sos41_12080 [Alphaproteobacteria bacterium SO-S41]
MTDDELRAVAANIVIELVAALSTKEDGSDTTDRLCNMANGLRVAAETHGTADAHTFLLGLADAIEPV